LRVILSDAVIGVLDNGKVFAQVKATADFHGLGVAKFESPHLLSAASQSQMDALSEHICQWIGRRF
jgi:hypothetical protein